jgi:putative inorganic carbon (HCO3(-)) transporter
MSRFCRQIVTFEWLILLLILPLALFPTPERAWVLLLIPLLWLARWVGYGRPLPPTPVDLPVWGLLLMTLVGLAVSDDRLYSLPKVTGMVYGIAVYYAAVAYVVTHPQRWWRVVGILLVGGLCVAGLGLLSVRWTTKLGPLTAVLDRMPQQLLTLPAAENGVSPNELAGVLLWVVPVVLALSWAILWHGRLWWRQWKTGRAIAGAFFVWGTTAVLLFTLLLTQSRAGLIGFAVGLLFMLFLAAGRWRCWLAAGLLAVLMVAGAAVYQSEPEQVKQFLQEQAGFRLRGEEQNMESVQGRLQIWERALAGIQDFPLTGMGINRFRVLVFSYYPTYFLAQDSDFGHAHNHWLQTALDFGLPGLVFYVALWLGAAVMLWLVGRRTLSPWRRAVAVGVAGTFVAYFVYGLVDAVALGARPGFIFWLLLGLAAALHGMTIGGEALANTGSANASPPG